MTQEEMLEKLLKETPGLASSLLKQRASAMPDAEKIPDPTNEELHAMLLARSRRKRKR